jgi:hypothetical protein
MQPVLLVRERTEIHGPAVVHGTPKLATSVDVRIRRLPRIHVLRSDSLGNM